MHLRANFLSSIVLVKLLISLAEANDVSFFYPPDNAGNTQFSYNSEPRLQLHPSALEPIRGTNIYEQFVDNIITSGINKMTLAINNLLTHEARGINVVFSPISISCAAALIMLGSNGITLKEISNLWGLASGIPDIDKKSLIVHEQFARMLRKLEVTSGFTLGEQLTFATAIFVQSGYPIRPAFKATAEELYRSNVVSVDFHGNSDAAQTQINQWVDTNTKGKIKTILDDLPSRETKVVLASALYFNAEWENHFFHEATRRRPFYINGRASQSLHETDMMSNGGEFPYYKDPNLGCEILGLPYKGNKNTMYVILPFESSKEKLRHFESRLTKTDLEDLVSKTRMTGAVILFPKMKIESTFNLKSTLESLGVTSLFDQHQANLALISPGDDSYRNSQSSATLISESIDNNLKIIPLNNQSNLITPSSRQIDPEIVINNRTPYEPIPIIGSRASETLDDIRQLLNQQPAFAPDQNPGLYADQVIHKVYMDINEIGTEAAAATSISLSRDGSRVTFRVDIPFLFFIRNEETKTILFWGSVVLPNPSYPKSS